MNNKTTITFKPRRYRATLLPSFILAWKGKHDARQGPYAVEAYINKLLNKAKAKEAELFAAAEHYLENTRKAAAKALFTLSTSNTVSNESSPTKAMIHKIRDTNAKRSTAKMTLIDCNETIIHVHSIAEEHIAKIRSEADTKIAEYVKAVCFENRPKYLYSDKPRNSYLATHKALDTAVKAFAESGFEKNMEECQNA